MATEQTYFDSGDHGGSMYVTLEQIVNDYMAGRDPDDYDANTPRHVILGRAKRAVRELHMDVMREIRGEELQIGENLQATLPYDYLDYVRISWVDEYGNVFPISENKSLSIANQYLQDSDYNFLYDVDGFRLEGTPTTQLYQENNGNGIKEYNIAGTAFAPNLDRSEQFEDGSYRIDKGDGVIRFDSNIYTKNILLEYVSDGLYVDVDKGFNEAGIRVHKHAEMAMHSYIHYYNIRKRRNVPRYAIAAARKEWFNDKRRAKRRMQQFTAQELYQQIKASDVWVKGER